jgi:hypothetical protein
MERAMLEEPGAQEYRSRFSRVSHLELQRLTQYSTEIERGILGLQE